MDKVVDNLRSNLCDAYSIEIDQITNPNEQNKDEKDVVKVKADELDRLHNLMKEKLKLSTYPEKVQILTLVPDKWSRKHCAFEYFGISEYLIRKARELKKTSGIMSKLDQKL